MEQVQVQDIRYAKSITSAYADAQSAEVAKQKALNAQETAKVEAETKKIEAQGGADASAIMTQSLTPEVLEQRSSTRSRASARTATSSLCPRARSPSSANRQRRALMSAATLTRANDHPKGCKRRSS
ncbi:MAG: hypothetical protein ACLTSX_01085 [Collinsella sp.]